MGMTRQRRFRSLYREAFEMVSGRLADPSGKIQSLDLTHAQRKLIARRAARMKLREERAR